MFDPHLGVHSMNKYVFFLFGQVDFLYQIKNTYLFQFCFINNRAVLFILRLLYTHKGRRTLFRTLTLLAVWFARILF